MIRGKKGLYNPWHSYTCRPKPGGKAQNWRIGDRRWKCRLGEDGLSSELSGTGPLALTLPAFDFNGEGATEIACDGRAVIRPMSSPAVSRQLRRGARFW